jgi:glucose/arabinose dehydrogenase
MCYDLVVRVVRSASWIFVLVALFSCASPVPAPTVAPTPEPTEAPIEETLPQVPEGFRITIAQDNLELPTTIATDGKHFYVTEFQTGRVKHFTDTNSDGVFDEVTVFAEKFSFPRGIAIEPETGDIFVASLGQINRLHDANGDGVADTNEIILKDLFWVDPSHGNNSIAFGPDGKLYVTIGHPRQTQIKIRGDRVLFKDKRVPKTAGTILRANPDGSDVQVYARGFRNPFDLFFAQDGTLYATDNGEDKKDGKPEGDELNQIVEKGNYGFPFFLGDPPPGSKTLAPLISFPQSSSPDGLVMYEADQFPEKYRGNIFIALFSDPRKVVRAWRDENGEWQYEDFVTGMNRPIDLVVGADGALYIADMNSGQGRNTSDPNNPAVIYRVEYVGP